MCERKMLLFSIVLFLLHHAAASPAPASASLSQPPQNTSQIAPSNLDFTYQVPNTLTVLRGSSIPQSPVNPDGLLQILTNIKRRMLSHLQDHDDGWLLPADDPIVATLWPVLGVRKWEIVLASNPMKAPSGRTQHLTYGVVVSVIDGWNQLINGLVGYCVVNFLIEDSEWGDVGKLSMYALRADISSE